MVEESSTRAPGAWSRTSDSTARTASGPNSMSTTTSAPATADATVRASVAPSSTRSPALPGVRFQTVTSCPARTTWAAIGTPIRPRPRKATFMQSTLGVGPDPGVRLVAEGRDGVVRGAAEPLQCDPRGAGSALDPQQAEGRPVRVLHDGEGDLGHLHEGHDDGGTEGGRLLRLRRR